MILQTRQTLPVLIQLFVTSAVETVSLNTRSRINCKENILICSSKATCP